ncbi:MAG: DUF1570 domain-containing protein [Fimbriimonadales bacterium]
MQCLGWVVGLWLLAQVPQPLPGTDAAQALEDAQRAIIEREAAELSSLAGQLAGQGETGAAQQVRASIPLPAQPNGPTRFVPLPEVVERRSRVQSGSPARLEEIRNRAAAELSDLAQRAAKSALPQYAIAGRCLRAALERQPDHKEARRLLGYVPHQGGWARPFAVQQLQKGNVDHPIFGWQPADWIPHLDHGELPAPFRPGRKTRWLPAAEADRLRADWNPPWKFATEHFEIQTNVPLAEAISFGRRLEAFHDLFMTLLADILGENLPLIQRFKNPALFGDGQPGSKPHQVYYFGSRDEFVQHLRQEQGPKIGESLGFYDPPKSGFRRVPAYFFRDPGGQIPVTATLYHEVSHQLLFETAGRNAYTKNVGNYWVFEGLGTYFETVSPQPDGSLRVGGLTGPRIEEALKSLVDKGQSTPLAEFIALDENAFMMEPQVYTNYQQAMAFTVFLMQWHQGTYRDAFLEYVRDAYHGRIKRAHGRSLQDRLGQTYATLDGQFLAFLKDGQTRMRKGGEPARAKPGPSPAIRTVPSR